MMDQKILGHPRGTYFMFWVYLRNTPIDNMFLCIILQLCCCHHGLCCNWPLTSITSISPPVVGITHSMADNKEGEDDKVYGGCEGPDAMYVKLVSSDGHEFIVKRDHALTSGTIKAMLSGPGKTMHWHQALSKLCLKVDQVRPCTDIRHYQSYV